MRRGGDLAHALRLVAERRPDVAVADICLKTGNGIDLIERIRDCNELNDYAIR